jgi:tetratricopeptide (TPR) repeat protein
MNLRAPTDRSRFPSHHLLELINRGDYQHAVSTLQAAGRENAVRNALGVCLMRLGRHDEALQVLRTFVLSADGVSERGGLIDAYKRNYALALLLTGEIAGAIEVLNATGDLKNKSAAQMCTAVKEWERQLGWFRWLDWKMNKIAPRDSAVKIDFELGEFAWDDH